MNGGHIMEKILVQRQIDTLYHFTQAENLANILNFGLLPRSTIENEDIYSTFNDEYRYDGCSDAVCMSIEFPNYRMFYKLRKEDEDIDWVVLKLDAQILCDFPCAFCWTNAGDSTMYNAPLENRMGKDAFLELFKNRSCYPTREETQIKKWFPTNPQAEVLVFGEIPISYISAIYFEKYNAFINYKNYIPKEIDTRVNRSVYSYRQDWSFWK